MTTDLAEYRSGVRAWLADADIPTVPLDLDERFDVLRDWQRALFEAGGLGISWSKEAGGQGLSHLHQLAFAEELAYARAPMPIGLIGLDVVGPSIDEFGQQWQREELLPKLLSGEHIWCQGFSEPEAGSDLASLRTRAVLDGDEFVISGQKVWTSWAHKAQWCALLVRTDPAAHKHAGISYLLVDMSTPGITPKPLEQMTGDREFCEVFFDEVRVPRRNLVGELNGGWAVATHTLGIERAAYTLRRRVDYEVAFEDAVAALRDHGLPAPETGLGRRVRIAIGKAHVALKVLSAQTQKTVARLTAGQVPTPEDSVDKLLLNEVEQIVFGEIAELLGPYRAVEESRPLGLASDRWAHDHLYSRATSIYGGTSQIQRNIISERLLGLPRG
ncbi:MULTISPECIES: acyl-CoA dehydrogenase family protein [Rhodococcus]|uniref:acyl-CoA dehydrogenase family protein n=1 Tax=Rhodococcus TaxID=1827 RepID=UPI001E468C25|nr:acyl-CoA dehydrogenase family protein [Rhodococcus pyridinivorans]MCD2119381.1 acyl-CoA dehydrogenase family protein [Rhodococcus pyridinivorans]MCZ4628297.1 acyl-CoA dehydrogenase family protein [Rhodococcus pyridinivorans]MCZ4649541.1 acyl-CoA dehydrogenase family protein [Rhodococcus pyridinivorans]MDJ0483359.1 acyl-CoA dehydrogenase family protein [Rhodococcus pyridinivorans]MDV7255612.1 acyl-CoA dehydrogenase family protein [Rhodococcus pyridinivorans]